MIGLFRTVAGMAGGKWLLGGGLAIIIALSAMMGIEKFGHSRTKAKLAEARSAVIEERAAHQQSKANFRIASAIANAWHIAAIAAQESHWRKQSDATQIRTQKEIDSALDLADIYVRNRAGRVRNPARTGAGSEGRQANPAPVATAAADPAGAGGMPELDASDVRICTVNTVKARGWQSLYESLKTPPAETPQPEGIAQ